MTLASPVLFGARIRRERKRQELTYAQLAARSGVRSPTTLKRIEAGGAEPGLFKAAAIAAALGLSLDALLAPPDCPACDGFPPAGFICPSCSRLGGAP